jgi:hypothetical protein
MTAAGTKTGKKESPQTSDRASPPLPGCYLVFPARFGQGTFVNTGPVQDFGAWRRVYLAHDGRERGSAVRAVPVFFLDDEAPSAVVARSRKAQWAFSVFAATPVHRAACVVDARPSSR